MSLFSLSRTPAEAAMDTANRKVRELAAVSHPSVAQRRELERWRQRTRAARRNVDQMRAGLR